MSKFVISAVVVGVGVAAYIVGTKAGRARYQEISDAAKTFWNDPAVEKARTKAYKKVEKTAKRLAEKIPS